jgi:uroporphyrinogen decarboxylase-like protein
MDNRERLLATLNFEKTDRVALLGGWILGDQQHQTILGCSVEEYWNDPASGVTEAHRALGVDGMIALHVPSEPGEYRGGLTKERFESYQERYSSPEDVLSYVQSLPSPLELAEEPDSDAWRGEFKNEILSLQSGMGNMVYLPTLWDIIHPGFEWYWEFGYENYLMFLQLYPEAADRFFAGLAGVARRKAEVVAALYEEMDMVPLTLIGTDICGSGGPLVSPKILREVYFPHVRYALEPVHDVGIRTVWHSDGDIRPIIQDILDCGISGLQGFQIEYGVNLAEIAQHRTVNGERLTIFAGPSSATTLPFGTVDDVRRDVEHIIDTLLDECALFILPANNILPDCPPENVSEMYRYAAEYSTR